MLSWGKNFMILSDLFIDYFPGYNKFRAVTMILVISEFCIPLLGLLALRDIFNGSLSKSEILKGLKISLGITGGFVLLVLIMPGIAGSFLSPIDAGLPDWLKSALIDDRKTLLKNDSFRSLIFILLSAGVLLAFIFEKLKKGPAIFILTVLILFDLWTIDRRYLNADRFEMQSTYRKTFKPSVADSYILKDKSTYRVLNLSVSTFNDNTPTAYFHHSIGGYHGAKLERYQELIDSVLIRNFAIISRHSITAKTVSDLQVAFDSTFALNMLNARYVIYNENAPPILNPKALGNAWFVEKPYMVENANQELSAINSFNPAGEAVIDNIFKDQVTKTLYPVNDNDTIELVSYKPDEIVYRYNATGDKLTVFSEIYYPAGWESFIDGKESKYFRTDFVLRGMVVPGGQHEIRFVFRPASYIVGNKISLASSVLLILLFAGYIVNRFRIKQ